MKTKYKINPGVSISLFLAFLTLFSILSSCSTVKTIRVLRKGQVAEKHFKIQVPFETKFGLTVIKVKVNGKEFDFLLDTGAPNAITKEYANKMNFKADLSGVFGDGNGGKDTINLVTLDEVEIGGIKFLNTGAAIMDMSQSKEIPCLGVNGIIGANLMSKAIWQWDFENKIVTITSSRDSLEIPENSEIIPFTKDFLTNQFYINIPIGNYVDKGVLVDLGSNGDYSSSKETFDSLRVKSEIKNYTFGFGSNASAAFGLNYDSVFYAQIPGFRIGNSLHENQIVSFSGKSKSIGVGYFSNFIITVDWSKDEMILSPKTTYKFSKLTRFPYNIILSDNKLIIGFVYDSPDIKNTGIAIGDQVLEINGKNYEHISENEYCTFLNSMYEYESNTMTIKLLNKSGEINNYTFQRADLLMSE